MITFEIGRGRDGEGYNLMTPMKSNLKRPMAWWVGMFGVGFVVAISAQGANDDDRNVAPINDFCIYASLAQLNPGTFTFTTIGATTDGAAEPCGFTGVNDADVWMMSVTPCAGTGELKLTGDFDRLLAVYTQCRFANGVLLDCAAGVGPDPATVSISAIESQPFIVRVGGINGASGVATIDFQFDSCLADIAPQPTGDCVVNVQDLMGVINAWGACQQPCPSTCVGDVNADCMVNIADLLLVVNGWGICQ